MEKCVLLYVKETERKKGMKGKREGRNDPSFKILVSFKLHLPPISALPH